MDRAGAASSPRARSRRRRRREPRKTAQMAHEAQMAQMALSALSGRSGRRRFCRSTDGLGRGEAPLARVRRYVVRRRPRRPVPATAHDFSVFETFYTTSNARVRPPSAFMITQCCLAAPFYHFVASCCSFLAPVAAAAFRVVTLNTNFATPVYGMIHEDIHYWLLFCLYYFQIRSLLAG